MSPFSFGFLARAVLAPCSVVPCFCCPERAVIVWGFLSDPALASCFCFISPALASVACLSLDLAVLPAADALCFDADFFLCFGFCPEAWARVAEAGVAAGPEPVLDWAEIVREEARKSAADSRMIFDEVFIMAIDLK